MALFREQLKQVLRRLTRAPLFTTITLITLAVGVGANTVIFSVVEGVLLKPLSYPHPEQLIAVGHRAPGIGLQDLNIAHFSTSSTANKIKHLKISGSTAATP